jgi:hypothetical protein
MKILIANLIILLANLCVLGLTVKLYTEHFKDRKIERRKDGGNNKDSKRRAETKSYL